MFGKYLNRFAVSFVLIFCFFNLSFSQINDDNSVLINGYQGTTDSPTLNKAMRLQGIGDFFFKKRSYAQAIPYYEEALLLLPKEADITFKLAKIYQNEKLWRLSILYYENTISLLQEQVNFGKSQLNSYISKIRIAYIYHQQGEKNKSIAALEEIRKEKSLLISSYPEAYRELLVFDNIYPETPTRKIIQTNQKGL